MRDAATNSPVLPTITLEESARRFVEAIRYARRIMIAERVEARAEKRRACEFAVLQDMRTGMEFDEASINDFEEVLAERGLEIRNEEMTEPISLGNRFRQARKQFLLEQQIDLPFSPIGSATDPDAPATNLSDPLDLAADTTPRFRLKAKIRLALAEAERGYANADRIAGKLSEVSHLLVRILMAAGVAQGTCYDVERAFAESDAQFVTEMNNGVEDVRNQAWLGAFDVYLAELESA